MLKEREKALSLVREKEREKEPNYPLLTDADIMKNQYDLETIEWNIINSFLSLRKLVRYQKLSAYICAKYVVFGGRNEMYADCSEDAWISTGDVLYFQPHITIDEMREAHRIATEEDEQEDEQELMDKEDRHKEDYKYT
jgi:hypothetical protein